jgi:osmotically inducible protein OsmC
MAIRTADAEWRGNLPQDSAHMRFGSGAIDGPYDFRSRMTEAKGTNPQELLGAAHAGCLSMARALQITKAGVTVRSIHTAAKVHFEERDGGWPIHRIDLDTEASISDMAAAAFEEHAQNAKKNSPISRALSGVDIHRGPSFCEIQRLDILCGHIFVWRASPVVTTG